MGVIGCGAKGFLCQLLVGGHKCASAVPQFIHQHLVVLSGKQQGLEAVTSPLQLSRQLSEYSWWHEAVCTFLQHLMTHHASAGLAARTPFLVSADIGQVVQTEAGGRSLRQTAARITAKAELLKSCCALGGVSSCSSVDTVHLFPPLWKMQPRSCCCSGLWTVVFRESQGVSFLGEPVFQCRPIGCWCCWCCLCSHGPAWREQKKKKLRNTTQWTFHLQSGRSAPTAWTETFCPSASNCTSLTVTVCSVTCEKKEKTERLQSLDVTVTGRERWKVIGDGKSQSPLQWQWKRMRFIPWLYSAKCCKFYQ